ncbi:PLP-dependent aminotransferase family protein [Roseibium sediminicola]|uniref:PLP-dependent aminotransferase family protein n=1 Tax=Roseibium sediminicola TaxID=2933272 RepID=A0ABT0GXM2_9HYPH|nr:PLP-dependent aminotransferase family protein [Roseibium sp. CAU 1639]MCK7614179.1 PLP-dependent aminotransferase family protein [Roseibium sp. CAU 1639]
MTSWYPDLSGSAAPRYIAIADAIEADLKSGRLAPGDKLPAQRQLAERLDLDFTTVARGYAEARRRGLLAARVGSGSFVTSPESTADTSAGEAHGRRTADADFSMNLPPEPDTAALRARMQDSYRALAADLVPLLRYQSFSATDPDRRMAQVWLGKVGLSAQPDSIHFAPGAQAALGAVLTAITDPGDRIACEAVTYPGIRSLCGQLRLELTGLPMDRDGPAPDAFETTCREGGLKALYLNPTINNPTTRTLPFQRRLDLIAIARCHGVPILEDDAYGQLCRDKVQPMAAIAPELTWYVGSLSKSLGAGLRLAHVVPPDQNAAWRFTRALRTASIMVSPLTVALATRWIGDGTAEALLTHVRQESSARQALANRHLADHKFAADPNGFHLWLELGNGWTPSAFTSQIRPQPVGLVEGDAFAVSGPVPNAVRLCLGGPHTRTQIDTALSVLAGTLVTPPQSAATYF